jgi:hypothetical protein
MIGSVSGPRTEGKTQLDDGAVERINGLFQIDAEVLAGIQRACDRDQPSSQVGINPMVAPFVGVGQRGARDVTANAQMIEPAPESSQAGFDVAQALAIGQLRKGHREKLVPAGKPTHLPVAPIAIHSPAEFVSRNEIHQLCENGFAQMHRPLPPKTQGKDGQKRLRNSNRKRPVLTTNSYVQAT